MNEERITESPSWKNPRGQVMKTPDDVAEMLRLRACGWGLKRIARQLGCSHHTVRDYVATGGVKPFKSPERPRLLDGLEGWLRERFIRHRGNADVVRQDLLAEKGVAVSRRTLQRAVQPYRQALKAEALATTRFETPPGRQLQIDFGERLVEIGGAKIKAFVFVATLGHSRRLHVRAFRAEKQEHWFAGLESAFMTFGGVPEEVLMDNPRALVVRHDAVSRSVQFNDKLIAFEALGLPSPRLRAVSGAHEGQDGEWRRLREEERGRGAFLCELGGIRGASRQVGVRGGERAYPRHDRRGTDRPLRA
jgi:transposase